VRDGRLVTAAAMLLHLAPLWAFHYRLHMVMCSIMHFWAVAVAFALFACCGASHPVLATGAAGSLSSADSAGSLVVALLACFDAGLALVAVAAVPNAVAYFVEAMSPAAALLRRVLYLITGPLAAYECFPDRGQCRILAVQLHGQC